LGKLCLKFALVRLEERNMEVLFQVGDEVRGAGEEDYVYCLRALTNLAKRAEIKGVQAEMWEQLDKALGDPGTWGPNLMTEGQKDPEGGTTEAPDEE
jgi:hypothetical protein